jgi:hypothetical protein
VRDWLLTGGMCAATVGAGWPWVPYLTGVQASALARAALGWLIGAALVSLAMLIVVYPGLPLNRVTLASAFAGTFAVGFLLERRSAPRRPQVLAPGRLRPAAVPLALAGLALAYGVLLAFRLGAIDSTDFVKAWGLKAIFAFQQHDLTFSGHAGPHLFYPLLVSNMNAAVYLMLGHVNDTVVRLPGALFGVALAGSTWWLLRLRVAPVWAALAVCLVVTTPEFTTTMTSGLADLTTAAYLTPAAIAAYLWVRGSGPEWAALAGFMAGAAAWTKLEGTPSGLVLLVTVLLIRRQLRTPGAVRWLAWFAAFVIPWQVYMRIHDIPLNRSHFAKVYLNLFWIATHVVRALADTTLWGIFWPLCFAIIVLAIPFWWRSEWRYLAALVIPNLVLTGGAYVTHYRAGVAGSVETTAPRLYLHLAPATAALAAVAAMTAYDRLLAPRLERVEVEGARHDQPAGSRDHG